MNDAQQGGRSISASRMDIKPLVPLCLAAFAGFLNLFGMSPFFVDIADDLGTTVSLVGYSATGAMLMTAVAGAIVGPMVDRLGGVRWILVIGLIVAATSAIATAVATNYDALVVARLLAGVGGSITGGVTVGAAAMFYHGRERQRALAFVTASMAMAVVIGIFLMTTLAGPYGWRGAFLILGGVLVGVAVLNRLMLAEPDSREPDSASSGRVRMLIDAYRPIFGLRSLRRLLAASALHPAIMNGATAYMGALLITQHDLPTQYVGLVFSLVGATYFVGNLLAGNLGNRPQHVTFSFGVLVMGLFWAGGYLVTVHPLVVAGMFGIATFAGGLAWVTLLGMVAERAPNNLGTAMVLTSSLLSVGAAGGIALGAGLLDIIGYHGIGIGLIVLMALAAAAGWVGETDPEVTDRKVTSREPRTDSDLAQESPRPAPARSASPTSPSRHL
jgi:MFS transporter, DHA1 family, inner membrane transport protein